MRTALVTACLMAAALPACRTVRTVELAPTLEAAVVALEGRPAVLALADGTSQRVDQLRLTDSTLVFDIRRVTYTVRRDSLVRLSKTYGSSSFVTGVLMGAVGSIVGGRLGVSMVDCRNNSFILCGLDGLLYGAAGGSVAGLFVNGRINPRRIVVYYDASASR